MLIKLTVDIPVECNDMSGNNLSKVYMELKKMCDSLNVYLNNIDEHNFNKSFIGRISNIEKKIKELEKQLGSITE